MVVTRLLQHCAGHKALLPLLTGFFPRRCLALCPQLRTVNSQTTALEPRQTLTPAGELVDEAGVTHWLEKDTVLKTVVKLVKQPGRHILVRRSAYLTYEKCTDPLDLELFFDYFQLSDTFYSWFLVVELHVWMCAMRFMQEGFDGQYGRDELIRAMWKDVEMRMKIMKVSFKLKNKSTKTLYNHYLAAMLSYDEGLVTDDRALANALWRNFFSYECQDATALETLVHYVRNQLHVLDNLTAEELLLQDGQPLQWTPLSDIIKSTQSIASSQDLL